MDSAVKKTDVSAGAAVVSTVADSGAKLACRCCWTGAKALQVDNVDTAMAAIAVDRRIIIILLLLLGIYIYIIYWVFRLSMLFVIVYVRLEEDIVFFRNLGRRLYCICVT